MWVLIASTMNMGKLINSSNEIGQETPSVLDAPAVAKVYHPIGHYAERPICGSAPFDKATGPSNHSSSPTTKVQEDKGSIRPKKFGRGKRDRKTPSHLKDYLCYSARTKDPPSVHPLQKVSSCKPYPIVNYVTCDRFSNAHKDYLVAITKVAEPKYFHEAVKDPR